MMRKPPRVQNGHQQPASDALLRSQPIDETVSPDRTITVALAGQPNVGKTTVFNVLTGLNQHVGNWPGKTIEQKVGSYRFNGSTLAIVDLPGTYSLSANSPEELIAREYIIREQPDVVAVIINAASLERGLYLVAELLTLPSPVVVGLNMVDVAEQEGMKVEPEVLEAALGVPVVPMIATKNRGIQELVTVLDRLASGDLPYQPRVPEIRPDHKEVLGELCALCQDRVPPPYPIDWVAIKLLEGDAEVTRMMREHLPQEMWQAVDAILRAHEDAVLDVAGGRYEWIGRMARAAMVRPVMGQVTFTDRMDRVATHPIWGLLLLASMLGVVFWFTYAVGMPLQAWLDEVVLGGLAKAVNQLLTGAPAWVRSLMVDGILGGAGMVATFLPILLIFFAAMGLLEDMGYMARAAYVMDRFMHLMGLHGKSFMPLFLGFGCNVPAVVGTRIIESPRARLLTILLAPLVPCTARMAVVALLAPAFFGAAAPLVSWGLILLGLLVLAVAGVALNRLLFKGERAAFIMELPLYHVPNGRTIGLLVWQRSVEFLKKAGTIILVISVLVWALSRLPHGDIESSLLAAIGRLMSPLGALVGLDWRMMVALLTSFIAKENSIAALGVMFGVGEADAQLPVLLGRALTPAAGLAFLTLQMLFIPCAATVAAIKQETASWRWTAFSVGFLFVISFAVAIVVYQVCRLAGL
ncbi:MAG: ferrous iron transport protein B [Chloroflexota bacterium]